MSTSVPAGASLGGATGGVATVRGQGGQMRVLVAGDRGYLGAVMVPFLSERDTTSSGSTRGGTTDATSVRFRPATSSAPATSGMPIPDDLAGFDAVVNLAAISNDPVGHLNPQATYSVNAHGAVHLGRVAKAAGVQRYLFASSCSLYGAARRRAGDRGRRVPPGHAVRREQGDGRGRASPSWPTTDFSPTYLRNATAYGSSPRLRADIVVNNLTGTAFTRGEVRLQSDGSPVAAAGARRGHRPRLPRRAGGAPRGRARPGVQRRPRRGRGADPRHRRPGGGGTGCAGDVRRRRRARQARLPGRLLPDP